MKKEVKIGALVLCVIFLITLSGYLYLHEHINYLIISGTLAIIMLLVTINFIFTNRSEESVYRTRIRQVLKTYDPILVRSNNLPNLEEKNIIRVENIEDLLDAQMEVRKPIYYQEQADSCAFVLLDNTEACVHIMKLNDQVVCPLETTISELSTKNKNKTNETSNDILNKIDDTAIVKVDNGKYVKVSPIKNNDLGVSNDSNIQASVNTNEINPTTGFEVTPLPMNPEVIPVAQTVSVAEPNPQEVATEMPKATDTVEPVINQTSTNFVDVPLVNLPVTETTPEGVIDNKLPLPEVNPLPLVNDVPVPVAQPLNSEGVEASTDTTLEEPVIEKVIEVTTDNNNFEVTDTTEKETAAEKEENKVDNNQTPVGKKEDIELLDF